MAPRKQNRKPSSDAVGTVTALVAENQSLKARVSELETERQAIVAALAGSGKSASKTIKVVKTRRKVTDPTILAKRREALAKARAARAEKRATAAADSVEAVETPAEAPKPKRIRKPKVVVEQTETESETVADQAEAVEAAAE